MNGMLGSGTDPYELPFFEFADATSANELAPGLRWKLPSDGLHPRYRPPRIVGGYEHRDTLGAASIALPERWILENPTTESVGLAMLEHARLFPGRIRKRSPRHHSSGQLILTDDFELIPASFSTIGGHGTLPESVDLTVTPERISGTHMFIGSLHPHFGHFLLEGLSRVWAAPMTLAQYPDSRLIVYEPGIPAFMSRVLALSGIDEQRILRLQAPAQVERIIVPDVTLRTHRWISSPQRTVWERIADAEKSGFETSQRRRVYLSRRGVANRPLENEADVEAIMERRGYEVIQPERLGIVEQIRLARECVSFAGCVGSQMYLAAFQRPGSNNLVLAPNNFCLRDDSLVADVMEHELSIVFGSTIDFRSGNRAWKINLSDVERGLSGLQ